MIRDKHMKAARHTLAFILLCSLTGCVSVSPEGRHFVVFDEGQLAAFHRNRIPHARHEYTIEEPLQVLIRGYSGQLILALWRINDDARALIEHRRITIPHGHFVHYQRSPAFGLRDREGEVQTGVFELELQSADGAVLASQRVEIVR